MNPTPGTPSKHLFDDAATDTNGRRNYQEILAVIDTSQDVKVLGGKKESNILRLYWGTGDMNKPLWSCEPVPSPVRRKGVKMWKNASGHEPERLAAAMMAAMGAQAAGGKALRSAGCSRRAAERSARHTHTG